MIATLKTLHNALAIYIANQSNVSLELIAAHAYLIGQYRQAKGR